MKFEIEIDGEKISLIDSELEIKDPVSEAPHAASAIFYWGSIAAAIRQRLDGAKNDYRQLRGRALIDALTAEPKLAEWKASAAFEGSEGFRQAKAIIEKWQRLYDQAHAIHEACLARSSTIQTIYKHEQAGRQSANVLGQESSDQVKEVKTQKLREIMKRKRH